VASHDLKEPVRKISIFGKMLQDQLNESLAATQKRYLNSIVSASERMAQLIDDLLAFSRLSHSNITFEPVDLQQLLHGILEDLEIPIKEKTARIEQHHLPTIQGIPLQLSQVFQNLISNSLKFAHPDRQPFIHIESEKTEQNGMPYHRIQYKDNGIGFSNDQADKIFEVFYRLHSRDRYEGTGVGLAIVKKIIDLHKGSIQAYGDENEGARFEILLPA
jgi:two-component system CheB/CheR fusion protein